MKTKKVTEAINQLIIDINFAETGCSTGIIDVNNIEILLDYIEKLESEEDRDYTTVYMKGCGDKDGVWKDKINNKLKELAKKLTEPNDDRWEKDDKAYYAKIQAQIRILKELKGE